MIPRIALGTVQFGQAYGIANAAGQVDKTQVEAMLAFARTAGIHTLDTAAMYGTAEQRLGRFGVADFEVITKVPALPDDATEPGRWIREQVEASMKRLRLDRLYGLLLHSADDLNGPYADEVAKELLELRRRGRVGKIGVSIYSPVQLEAVLERLLPDLVQAPLNVFDDRLRRSGWLERLVARGTEVHVRSIFLQGLLLMPPEKVPPYFGMWRGRLAAWHAWVAAQGLEPTEACLRHVLAIKGISRIIVGCDSLEQLRGIVECSAGRPLPAPPDLASDDEGLVNPAMWNISTKTVAIIQARMGSSRLPGKVLADVHGRPMLQCLLDRVKAVPEIDEIVVATTTDPADDVLARWIVDVAGLACFRGSTNDVLDRYYHAAQGCGADVIVRLTGDDPLKDPKLIGQAIRTLLSRPDLDYVSTFIRPTYPEGLDVEVFRAEALERAHREAKLASEHEHVTPYIWKNPQMFKLHNIEQERDLSAWRWTVDKPADLEFVRAIYSHFPSNPLVSYEDLVALIDAHPELAAINSGTLRQEGYLKSLAGDQQ